MSSMRTTKEWVNNEDNHREFLFLMEKT